MIYDYICINCTQSVSLNVLNLTNTNKKFHFLLTKSETVLFLIILYIKISANQCDDGASVVYSCIPRSFCKRLTSHTRNLFVLDSSKVA